MKFAADAFKVAHKEMDIDKVQDLKDEISEQQQIADEISQIISSPIGNDTLDEDELLKELEELEQETIQEELLVIPTPKRSSVQVEPIPTTSKSKLRKSFLKI